MNDIAIGLSYDDVLLIPGYSKCLPHEINTSITLANKLFFKIPVLSAAMDTVTDSRLAATLAIEGGAGVIHRNFSVEQQAKEISKVKEALSWIIHNPVTITAHQTIRDAYRIMEKNKVGSLPVVDRTAGEAKNGKKKQNAKIMGIITKKDLMFEHELTKEVSTVMVSNTVCYEGKNPSFSQIMKLFQTHRVGQILLTNKKRELLGLVSLSNLNYKQTGAEITNRAIDDKGRLLVGAAVSPHGLEERSEALMSQGVDFLVLDSAHGHSYNVIRAIKILKKKYPDVVLIAGNVVSAEATEALCKAGADVVKVGMGPGSICTTRIVSGTGMPQFTAVQQCAFAAQKYKKQIIADGGLRYSGDITKAIGVGACCVMIGSMFAGLEEAPGKTHTYKGKLYKFYRGMGSVSAIVEGSGDRYQFSVGEKIVPEGVETRVPYKGDLKPYLYELVTGLKKGMGYCGCKSIKELMNYKKFVKVTHAGIIESHVHDVDIIDNRE